MRHSILCRSMVIVLLMMHSPVQAQTERSGGDAAARVMQQMQQVMADKARLQTENDSLKKQLDDAKAKLTSLNIEQGKLQQRARQIEVSSARTEAEQRQSSDELEQTRTQMQALVGKFRETAQTLKDVESDRSTLQAEKETRERALERCVDKNAQMYLLGNEVLDQYDHFGLWTALKSKDAFTQLTRTRLENLADEYRDRINALRVRDKSASVTP